MGKLNMTRRSFVKTAAVSAAVAAVAGAASPTAALAENENAAATESAVTRIRSCCRGCGKVECGVWVYVQDGKVIRTEGDEDCFLTMGNHCSKGQASIQAAYHPDRIKYPMKRTNPKGDDDPGWVRISWDEAYQTIADNILEITEKYGNESTFTWCGTGRQWCMQSDAGMALLLFGTPNIVAAYQVCKGPRHFASRIDNVQAWSWSELINHSTKFVQWATEQSQSNYDDAARTVVDVARCADAFISVDPRQTNLGRTAKYWLPLRPGTDNALALGWCHLILKNDLCDWQFLKRWSNSPFIVVPDMDPTGYEEHVQNGGYPYAYQTRLLTEADIDPTMVDWEIEGDGDPQRYLVFDQLNNRWTYWQAHPEVGEAHWEGENWQKSTSYFDQDLSRLRDDESKKPGKVYDLSEFNPLIDPAMYGEFDVKLKDGTTHKGRPVWDIWAEYLEGFTPEKVSEITEVDAQLLTDACLEWATRDDPRIPNGGINYGLAIEHHGMSTQNCRAIMAACAMVGAIDTPGGQRGATNGWTTQSGPTSMYPGADGGSNPASFVRRAVLRAVQPHRRLREVPHAVLVRRVGRLQLGHGVHAPRRECPLRDSRGHDRFRRPHEHGQRQLQLGGPAHAGLPLRGEPVALADLGCGGHPSAGVPLDRDERPAHRPGLRRLLQPVRARRRPSGRVQERSSVLPGARPLLRRALLHRPGRSLLGEEVGRDRQVCGPARPGVRVPRR